MGKRVNNILEGIYKKQGIYELFNRLVEMYHISFYNLDMKNVEISFKDEDVIIEEKSSKRRFIVHFEDEYVVLTKEYLDYKVLLYIDCEGGVFREIAFFNTSDGKILAIDELNDVNLHGRRLVKANDIDCLLCADFEQEYSSVPSMNIKEEYFSVKKSEDTSKSFKKVTLGEDGLYFEICSKSKSKYLADPLTSVVEVVSSRRKPTLKFYGRFCGNNNLLKDSVQLEHPNIIISYLLGKDKNCKWDRFIVEKVSGYLVLKGASSDISELQIKAIRGTDDEFFSSKDIDILIDFLSTHLKIDTIDGIVGELLSLKDEFILVESKDNSIVNILDYKLQRCSSFEELLYDVRNNLEQYELLIQGKTKSMFDENGDEKRLIKD